MPDLLPRPQCPPNATQSVKTTRYEPENAGESTHVKGNLEIFKECLVQVDLRSLDRDRHHPIRPHDRRR